MQSSAMQNVVRTIWGALLAVSGVLAILYSLRAIDLPAVNTPGGVWVVLAALAVLVVVTYVAYRSNWRPLVVFPAGVIATIAAVEAVSYVPVDAVSNVPTVWSTGVFVIGRGIDGVVWYAGLGLTCVLAYVLAKAGSRPAWALILAAVLAASALEAAVSGPPGEHSVGYAISVGLVLVGGYLLSRVFGSGASARAVGHGQLQPQG